MQPITETLRALREESGLSQIAVAQWLSTKYKPTKAKAVSAWERGNSKPNAEQLLYLCDLYEVDNVRITFLGKKTGLNDLGVRKLQEYAQLLSGSSQFAYVPEPEPLRIRRVYNLPVSAGFGEYLDSDDYEEIEVDATVPQSADYGVRVSGDSMYPRFTDRQVVWVHEQPAVDHGEIGIFYYQGDAYIKKLENEKKGLRLISINPEYKPIKITDTDSFRVFGKVVG